MLLLMMMSVAHVSKDGVRCRDVIAAVGNWVDGSLPIVAENMLQSCFHPLYQAKPHLEAFATSGERLSRISSAKPRISVRGYQLGIDD